MIKPGIKLGPQNWQKRLQQSNAHYCEVWFRIDQPELFTDMFAYLSKHRINTGLHFWAVIDNRWEPNIAYPGPTLEKTLKLIEKTIDLASKHDFHYVNIHCGNRTLIKVNLDSQLFIPDETKAVVNLSQAEKTLSQSLARLNNFAAKKKVLLLTETIVAKTPTTAMNHPQARLKATDYFAIPVASLIKLEAEKNFPITNDFCHTFADEYDQPLVKLWQALWSKTSKLAPHTKLLHINTVTPPYNGTDSHGGITAKDFKAQGIFPTREKLKKLLSLFKNKDDVWAVNEPSQNHAGNYHALVKILSEIG